MAENPIMRFKLGDYLRPGGHKVAISVTELVQQTNEMSTKNRPGCTPKLIGSDPKDLFLKYNVTCTLKSSDPKGHDTKVHFDLDAVKDDITAKDLDVACSCSCPAFLYWGAQWNLHQRDALEGEARPKLIAPTERKDLRDHFVICKHLKAVFERILPSVQHNIVKIVRQRNVDQYRQRQRMQEEEKAKAEAPKAPAKKAPAPKPSAPAPTPKKIIKRDAPATPKEKKITPKLDPKNIPTPTEPLTPATPGKAFTPIPTIEGLDDEVRPVQEAQKPMPVNEEPSKPANPPLKPVKSLPGGMSTTDRLRMQQLQRDEQRRRDRDTQRRLRSNPGFRR